MSHTTVEDQVLVLKERASSFGEANDRGQATRVIVAQSPNIGTCNLGARHRVDKFHHLIQHLDEQLLMKAAVSRVVWKAFLDQLHCSLSPR